MRLTSSLFRPAVGVAGVALFAACGGGAGDTAGAAPPPLPELTALEPAAQAITAEGMLQGIRDLAADSMGGRAPGSVGEDRTVAYLTNRFQAMGLEPGNPDGTWTQSMQLAGIRSTPEGTITRDGNTSRLAFTRDFVMGTKVPDSVVTVSNSELVFVGYGIVAPELGWDDYKDVDVTGKTVVILVNDPPITLPNDTALDPEQFKGDAMTYYGRWTYKYEQASAKGAAAALIIHETGPAGYPYSVVVGSWGAENFDIAVPGGPPGRVRAEGWLSLDAATRLLAESGLPFDSLKRVAATKEFRPAPLGATFDVTLRNRVRTVASRNVVAKLTGSDEALRDEYIVYTAHWDHLGINPIPIEDSIFNGALDNASGTAALLEIANAYTKFGTKPPRTIVFLAVTAEEQGLLGAKYYAEHPLYPLEKTLANLNMDGINQWGETSDVTVIGLGNSTLDLVLDTVMQRQGRTLRADPEPEKGFFFRSDHFEFAKMGVPALYLDAGTDYIGKPADYGHTKRAEYTANDYHKPSDEVKDDWDLTGAVADARAMLEIGWRLAYTPVWPTWTPGNEFKARRDSMLAGAAR